MSFTHERPGTPTVPPSLRTICDVMAAVAARHALLVGVKDAGSGRYLWVSDGLAQLMGPGAAVGRTDGELFDPALAQALRSADVSAASRDDALAIDHRFEHGGQRREFNVLRIRGDVDGRPVMWCVWQDLAPGRQRDAQLKAALDQIEREQKASQALRRELSDQGLRDSATGLYTSSLFEDQLRREVDLSNREHREFALVHLALDELPGPASGLGAPALERVHEAMGRLLRSNTRAMDASCRIDDRHFAVLLSGVGLATAHSRMEGLRRQVATQIVVLDGQELSFTVSMGVASFPHTAQSKDEVVEACRSALAQARQRGGNTVVLASIRFGPLN